MCLLRRKFTVMYCLCRVTFRMKMRQNTAHGQPALQLIGCNICIDAGAKLTRSHGAGLLWLT